MTLVLILDSKPSGRSLSNPLKDRLPPERYIELLPGPRKTGVTTRSGLGLTEEVFRESILT